MNSSKFDQMFIFISQYKYEINKIVTDNLKCGKCRNILINAYCVPCGCSYCCDCVSEMLSNGVEKCPGQTDDCKEELILNSLLDYKTNKSISNVVIKCPEEMCLFECAIINMEEHTRVCENKRVKCPFANLGCDGTMIANEMLNNHCQSPNFNHCKLLIEMIDNLRNEMDILKASNIKSLLKIENLEANLRIKDELIEKINKNIDLMKLENEIFKQEFDSFKQILENKFIEIDNKMKRTDERMKIDRNKQKQDFDEFNENLEKKAKELFVEIEEEKQTRIKSIKTETNSIKTILDTTNKKWKMIETSLNVLNKMIALKFPLIEWKIDKFDQKRLFANRIESEHFTGIVKQYNLKLALSANGDEFMEGKGCSVYLLINSGEFDNFLSWPFKADVTVNIINKTNRNISKSIRKYCILNKPFDSSLKLIIYNTSAAFNYFHFDLKTNKIMLDNCFDIECFIDFK